MDILGKIKKYKVHILIWAAFIFWESITVGIMLGAFSNLSDYSVHYTIIIVCFYFQSHVMLPWVAKRNGKIVTIPLFIVLFLSLYISFQGLGDVFLGWVHNGNLSDLQKLAPAFLVRNLYRGIFFMAFSTGYFYFRNYLSIRKHLEKLEKEQLKSIIRESEMNRALVVSENAYLRAQINPHFLFNTLDFMYYHSLKHSAIVSDTVIRLSEIMRFAINPQKGDDKIFLREEIPQVENLVYLQQLFAEGRNMVELEFSTDLHDIKLIPLVVLTLVENIFKHGDLSKESGKLVIKVENNLLMISTINPINTYKRKTGNQSGLENIGCRLLFTYGPQDVDFTYGVKDEHFVVNLALPLHLLIETIIPPST